MFRFCAECWRVLLAWCLCALALPGQAGTAVWMWEEDSYALLESPAQAQEAIAFMRRHDIDTVYLYADAHAGRNLLLQQPVLYSRLITQLHRQGLQVHSLLGSWPLHTERYILPENRPQALAMVQRILDYNQASTPTERFDGINLDIEPHVLDDWSSRREEYLQMWAQLSEAWMALKREYRQTLQIGPAMAFWLDGIPIWHAGERKPASEHLQDIYDHVVLMDYRDKAEGPDGILSHAQDELAYGRKIGKRVLLGVETSPNEIPKLTFHDNTPAQMAHELGLVRQALSRDRAFGGFVLHHYGSYRRWLGR